MKTLLSLLLIAVLVKAILLYKTINALPLNELRRRARANKSKQDQAIYKLASYHSSLSIFIWLAAGVSGGVLIVMLAKSNWWLGLCFVLLLGWMLFSPRFNIKPGGRIWHLAGLVATPAAMVLSFLHPAISSLTKFSHTSSHVSTGLFESEDLLELLDKQAWQVDNRIDERELKIAKGALSFVHKTASQVMTPISTVKWLSTSDLISPKLMDELHKTGQSRFPVVKGSVKSSSPEIVGSLYIKDLLNNLDKNSPISGLMSQGSSFINESHTLYQALDGLLKSKQYLLIVINNFEEITGVLTLEDVLEQILGEKVTTDFEDYHSKHSVAGHDPTKTKSPLKNPEVKQ